MYIITNIQCNKSNKWINNTYKYVFLQGGSKHANRTVWLWTMKFWLYYYITGRRKNLLLNHIGWYVKLKVRMYLAKEQLADTFKNVKTVRPTYEDKKFWLTNGYWKQYPERGNWVRSIQIHTRIIVWPRGFSTRHLHEIGKVRRESKRKRV